MSLSAGCCRIFLQYWGKLKIIDLSFVNLQSHVLQQLLQPEAQPCNHGADSRNTWRANMKPGMRHKVAHRLQKPAAAAAFRRNCISKHIRQYQGVLISILPLLPLLAFLSLFVSLYWLSMIYWFIILGFDSSTPCVRDTVYTKPSQLCIQFIGGFICWYMLRKMPTALLHKRNS